MKNATIALIIIALLANLIISCSKGGGGGRGCSRSPYPMNTKVLVAVINSDSLNLLETKALTANDVMIYSHGKPLNYIQVYGSDQTTLKYISFSDSELQGLNLYNIVIGKKTYTLSFNKASSFSSCTGPSLDLSNFKLNDKLLKPVFGLEELYYQLAKGNYLSAKIYIIHQPD